ncbi:cold shock domain protein 1, partial [Prunus dulcis]
VVPRRIRRQAVGLNRSCNEKVTGKTLPVANLFSPQLLSLSRDTLSPQSLSLPDARSLSPRFSAPATAGPETGPDRLASPSRSSSARFPRRKPRTPAARSTGSNRNCSAVAPPPPPPKLDVIFIPINGSYLEIGVSTARTQQAGPSRGQAAWDYLIMSARRARTRGRGQRWGPNPPPPSPSPPPSPPVPSPPPSPPAGDNALDMRHVLSQFTRTMATALRGRRGTESSEIKRVKELGAKEFVGSTDPAEAELWITDVERIFEVLECPAEDRVRLATFLLKGNAYHWWKAVKRGYENPAA